MSTSVLDMSISVDGYIADPDDFLGGDDSGTRRAPSSLGGAPPS